MADTNTYYVELEKNGQPTRIGPFRDARKAKTRQRFETKDWDGKGKKPELTVQPANWRGTPGLTTATRRQSPRTGKTGDFTVPGVPKSPRDL